VIPEKLVAVATNVAIFTFEFPAFMTGGPVVSIAQIAAQLAAIVRDPGLVVMDIPPQAAVACQRRGDSDSD
jgi:hypothetical protein